MVREGTLRVQATNCASSFEVTTDGVGVVGHMGAVLLGELAVLLADGGDCLSDLAVLRDQPALFGPVASTPTAWRVVERAGQDPDGLARLRAARAHARARAWAAGGDPDVELLIIDADATLCWRKPMPSRARPAPTSTPSGLPRCWRIWTAAKRPASRWRAAAAGQRLVRRRWGSDGVGRPRLGPAPC